MNLLAPALADFRNVFPMVQVRLIVHPFSMATGRWHSTFTLSRPHDRCLAFVVLDYPFALSRSWKADPDWRFFAPANLEPSHHSISA